MTDHHDGRSAGPPALTHEELLRQVEHACSSPRELLEALGMGAGVDAEALGGARDWVYRGVDSSLWPLVPAALRAVQPGQTWSQQEERERVNLRTFLAYSDAQGLSLPPDLSPFWSSLSPEAPPAPGRSTWPPRSMLSHVALAQHYRVPTCLLDWSRKPLIAAWFAARTVVEAQQQGARRPRPKGERLVIWAMRRRMTAGGDGPDCFARSGLELVWAPRAPIPNLHLQSGVFSLLRPPESGGSGFDACHGQALVSACSALGQQHMQWLRAYTLPHDQALELLRRLHAHFVHGAVVMAGFEGAFLAWEESRWLNRTDST